MILRIAILVFIALASTVRPVAHGLPIQLVQTGVFLRSTIETYPEAEARPILTFLDQGRVVADDATRDLLAGRNAEVFGRIQETARQMGQSVDADGAIEQIKAMYGTVTSVEYRAQGIVGFGNNPDVHDLSKVHAATWYAVRSTTHSSEGLYLQISTLRLKGVTLLAAVTFSTYLGNVPPWLKPAAGTERNDGKRVRAVLSAQPDQLAQITLEYGSGVTESGSYAKAGSRHRVETGPQTGSERVVWLFDGDRPVITLYPDRREYSSEKWGFEGTLLAPMVLFDRFARDDTLVVRSLGAVTVEGHQCEKIEITEPGKESHGTVVYSARDLGGAVILIDYGELLAAEASGAPTRARIKVDLVTPSKDLFLVPADFREEKK